MYNETYDDYIRSILGYPVRNQFDQFNQGQQEYQGYQEYRNPTFNSNINISGNNVELENSYPEIYKIVYPMITKKCENVRESNITKDDIENMTDEIYYALESRNETQININLRNDVNGLKKVNTSSTLASKNNISTINNIIFPGAFQVRIWGKYRENRTFKTWNICKHSMSRLAFAFDSW